MCACTSLEAGLMWFGERWWWFGVVWWRFGVVWRRFGVVWRRFVVFGGGLGWFGGGLWWFWCVLGWFGVFQWTGICGPFRKNRTSLREQESFAHFRVARWTAFRYLDQLCEVA